MQYVALVQWPSKLAAFRYCASSDVIHVPCAMPTKRGLHFAISTSAPPYITNYITAFLILLATEGSIHLTKALEKKKISTHFNLPLQFRQVPRFTEKSCFFLHLNLSLLFVLKLDLGLFFGL